MGTRRQCSREFKLEGVKLLKERGVPAVQAEPVNRYETLSGGVYGAATTAACSSAMGLSETAAGGARGVGAPRTKRAGCCVDAGGRARGRSGRRRPSAGDADDRAPTERAATLGAVGVCRRHAPPSTRRASALRGRRAPSIHPPTVPPVTVALRDGLFRRNVCVVRA